MIEELHMENRPIRVGVIGANPTRGWAPAAHLPALSAMPEFEVIAVCTTKEKSAQESAKKYGASMAFSDHRDMLREADLDAVAVSVKVPEHSRLTMDVLEAGKHVFTEWPLGANLQEAEELASVAAERGVANMVGLQSHCHPTYLRLKELINEGFIGEVLSVNLKQHGSGLLSRTSDRTWQRDKALGANPLTIHFGHVIDAVCMCIGEISEVEALVTTQADQWLESDTQRTVDVTSPDNVMLVGTLDSGAVISAHVSMVPEFGSGYRLEVYGRGGTLVLTASEHPQLGAMKMFAGLQSDSDLREVPIPDRLSWVPETVPAGPPFNVAQMWWRFGRAIRIGQFVQPDFEYAVQRHRFLDAVQRASDSGIRQTL